MFFKKILRSGLPLKMRHKHGAFEIRVGEQNGQERGLRGVSFSGQNPRRLFANLLHARLTGGLETRRLRRSCRRSLVHSQATQL